MRKDREVFVAGISFSSKNRTVLYNVYVYILAMYGCCSQCSFPVWQKIIIPESVMTAKKTLQLFKILQIFAQDFCVCVCVCVDGKKHEFSGVI